MTLRIEHLAKSFGGLRAVDDVSISFPVGEATCVMGPNGSGKTTLIDLIGGFVRLDSGSVHLDGRALGGLPAHEVARGGVVRTFQDARPFPSLSVIDNVLLGFPAQARESPYRVFDFRAAVRHRARADRQRAGELLDLVGLLRYRDAPSSDLSYGQQKLLSLARALAVAPQVLLLDEPSAGLAPSMIETVLGALRTLRDGGTGIVVVEHNVEFVRALAQSVVFLSAGRVLAHGPAQEVMRDESLSRLYFGVS